MNLLFLHYKEFEFLALMLTARSGRFLDGIVVRRSLLLHTVGKLFNKSFPLIGHSMFLRPKNGSNFSQFMKFWKPFFIFGFQTMNIFDLLLQKGLALLSHLNLFFFCLNDGDFFVYMRHQYSQKLGICIFLNLSQFLQFLRVFFWNFIDHFGLNRV